MKYNKLFLIGMLLLAMMVVGCSSDSENDDNDSERMKFYGTWELISSSSVRPDMVTVRFMENGKIEVKNNWEWQDKINSWSDNYFKPSGAYQYTVKGEKLVIDNMEFSWTMTDKILSITENYRTRENEYYIIHKYLFEKTN